MTCFYCQAPKTSICVCLDCRTKLELDKLELERLKKDQELRKKNYWNGIRSKQKDQKKEGRAK